jgi:nicotinate phosphoribosyltransferase
MVSGTAADTTGLRTDHYELTMLAAARRSGVAGRRAVFEVFSRALPPGRRFGVVAGTGRIIHALDRFGFADTDLEFLATLDALDPDTIEWLAKYRFSGTVHGYAEGETYFPGSPILRVEGSFGEAVLLETLVLSILNHDSAVASAAARMVIAAPNAPLVDMGTRRTHEEAAIDAARAAYIGGFAATSNLEAGHRYGVPTTGTAAHAFTLVHDDEVGAFTAQLQALGPDTTLLVDTFATEAGLRAAVRAANRLDVAGPGAVRIDSGDLAEETRRARVLLDELGATETKIVVSGDLDEYEIARLERDARGRAPIDGYGVGTRLVTGSGHPTAGFVYKLVEVDGRPVSKRSTGKATIGGAKRAYRVLDDEGTASHELLVPPGPAPPRGRPLDVLLYEHGDPASGAQLDGTFDGTLDLARAHHRAARAELRIDALALEPGAPALRATRWPEDVPEVVEGR